MEISRVPSIELSWNVPQIDTLTGRSEGLGTISTNQKKRIGKNPQYDFVVPFNDSRMRLTHRSPRYGLKLNENTDASIDVINVHVFKPHICKTLEYLRRDSMYKPKLYTLIMVNRDVLLREREEES